MLKWVITIKTQKSSNYTSHTAYVEHNPYEGSDNIVFNTNNIYKHTNQYPTDVFNSYNINKHIVKTHNISLLMMLLLPNIIPLTLMIHTNINITCLF